MAITSKLSRMYAGRMVFIGVLCAVFGVWGIYDLVKTIPARQAAYDGYQRLGTELGELEQLKDNGPLTAAQKQQYTELEERMSVFGDKVPSPPGKFDKLTQWFFILCLPFAPYYFWLFLAAKRKVYVLDDDGSLTTPQGAWSHADIADIVMSRWMSKSVAQVVHRDGSRAKLDDYIHKDLHLIVGAIASEKYPDQWTAEAKPVKAEGDDDASAEPAVDEAALSATEEPSATTVRGGE